MATESRTKGEALLSELKRKEKRTMAGPYREADPAPHESLAPTPMACRQANWEGSSCSYDG